MKIVSISSLTVADPGEAPPGGGHLFLDQTEARRAEKKILLDRAPSSQDLDDRAPHLSEGLDPSLGQTLFPI